MSGPPTLLLKRNPHLQGEDEDHSGEASHVDGADSIRELAAVLDTPKSRALALRIEAKLNNFLLSSNVTATFEFASGFSRMLVHKCAQCYGMEHFGDSHGGKRAVVVRKVPQSGLPSVSISALVHRYEEELQPSAAPTHSVKILSRKRTVAKKETTASEASAPSDKLLSFEFITPSDMIEEEKLLEERRAEYERARARIFQDSDTAQSTDMCSSRIGIGSDRCETPKHEQRHDFVETAVPEGCHGDGDVWEAGTSPYWPVGATGAAAWGTPTASYDSYSQVANLSAGEPSHASTGLHTAWPQQEIYTRDDSYNVADQLHPTSVASPAFHHSALPIGMGSHFPTDLSAQYGQPFSIYPYKYVTPTLDNAAALGWVGAARPVSPDDFGRPQPRRRQLYDPGSPSVPKTSAIEADIAVVPIQMTSKSIPAAAMWKRDSSLSGTHPS